MGQEEIKQLLTLMENAEKGEEKEFEDLEAFLESKGLSYEDAILYKSASMENKPETPVEKRLQKKGKAADDKKYTRDALDIDSIAKAFGVDLKKAQEEGELEQGELMEYLSQRGVFARVPGESTDEYKDRMVNAFGDLGLNFNSPEDRKLVTNSIAHHNQMDVRNALKEEAGSGVKGFLTRTFAPRAFEKAQRDIMTGEGEASKLGFLLDNAKELGLDLGENLAMTLGAPVTGVLKAIANAKKIQSAYKAFKKGKKILDGRTKANKALKGAGTIAGTTADAAAVPYAFEALDDIAFDDADNVRSNFDNGDAMTSTAVNLVAPRMLGRVAGRVKAMLGDNADKIGKAAEDVVKVFPEGKGLKKYLEPLAVNKAGKTEMVRQLPIVSSVAEDSTKKNERQEKKNMTKAEKISKWRRGFSIPLPGDKDFMEFQAWLEKNRRGLAKYLVRGNRG